MAKLVECIPNFSVSREKDERVFQALVDTANAVPGCTLFDVQSDGNHNRCVFTLIGSPAAIEEAAFLLAKKAVDSIDMTKHEGQHPRMGAVDVIPFVPQMDVTVAECVEISKRVAERCWREFRFSLLTDLKPLLPGAPEGEQALLQGVVDCCIEENGALTVVDYKTDRVEEEPEIRARAEYYRTQLDLYAQALQRIFGMPVREKILYFLHSGREWRL